MRLFPATITNLIDFGLVPNGTVTFPPFGPMTGPQGATTLTNKAAGPPSGRHFTRKQKADLLFGIYQEGLLAKEALKRFDGMSELEMAELELAEAETAHDEAANRQKTSYSRRDYDDAEAAANKADAARDRVAALRKAEAKRVALDDAKAKIKKQVADAIAKRRGH